MGEHQNSGHKKWKIFLIISVIILLGYLLHRLYFQDIIKENQKFCENVACYKAVVELSDSMDPSMDPCRNFHQFSCGNANRKQIPPTDVQKAEELRNELEAMIIQTVLPKDTQKIRIQKNFYQSCVNVEEIKADNDETLLLAIKEIGGWPLLEGKKWNQEDFDWKKTIITCRQLGLPFDWFFEFGIYAKEWNYFKIGPPIINPGNKEAIDVIAKMLGKKIGFKDMIDFEQRLFKIAKTVKTDSNIKTVEDLQQLYPPIDWLDFFNNITEKSYEFTEESEIASNIDDYILKLHMLLTSTPKSTQANYIVWKIIEYFAPYIRSGLNESERAEFCQRATKKKFPHFSAIEYIKRYPIAAFKNDVEELANLISEELLNRQLEELRVDIGSQIETFDDDFLERHYLHIKDLNFDSQKPKIIDIIKDTSRVYYSSIFDSINETSVDNTEVDFPLPKLMTVNVFFDGDLNKIVVPPSVLHGFLYEPSRPQYLNFANLGTSIAKEYIKNLRVGNATNVRASDKCFEADFKSSSNQSSLEAHVVDILGRDISYNAYQKWIEIHGEELKLPLLHFTPKQLFWIKSISFDCGSKYNNLLSVRHSRHFPKDFSCPEDAPMNPLEKC